MARYLFLIVVKLIAETVMNLKRTFGAILALIGIIGLIYTVTGVINESSWTTPHVVMGIIAGMFFFSGISLVSIANNTA